MNRGWLDGETVGVWIALAVGTGFTLAQLNAVLNTCVLALTVIYTVRKIRRQKDSPRRHPPSSGALRRASGDEEEDSE